MENKEYNAYLKKLEEIHAKKFKDDKSYLESCKASKDLSPKDYKIQPNHKLDEYFKKYGNKLEKGKLVAFKENELWLMNKRTNYWKIENSSDFIYFEAPANLKPLWISLASLLVVGAIAGGVTAGVLLSKGNGNSGSGGEGGEDEPSIEPIPGGKDRAPMDITSYVPSFNGLKTMVSDPDTYNVIVGDWINVQLKHQDSVNQKGGLVVDEDGDGFLDNGDCYQQIRIIGFNHKNQSTDANPEGACTFEFKTLLSDENGYSLATYWQDSSVTAGSNYNYLDSSIRSALNGKYDSPTEGSTKAINWFQYFGADKDATDNKYFSTNYSDYSNGSQINNGKSALSMLPTELSETIVPVTKKVNIYNGGWSETDFTDKLFLLTPNEMGYTSSNTEGIPYAYYEGHASIPDAIRSKKQVKGIDGARNMFLSGNDLDGYYTSTKYNYVGYNSSSDTEGGQYWLRAPYTGLYAAWICCDNGYIDNNTVYGYANAIAPAFCI